jgi:uncharacterized protein
MNLFDATSWLGPWPFASWEEREATAHARELRRHGIQRALVSPLRAVFAPVPVTANRTLLAETKTLRALIPLPVINPALANWEEQLAEVAVDPRVRAVRWLPSYHNYRLTDARATACARALQAQKLGLVLTVRLVDERHEYFALRIRGLRNEPLLRFLRRHPELPVLLSGLMRPDITQILPAHRQVLADLSFAEWDRTLERLVENVSVQQLVFGSHAPFHLVAANAAKVTSASLPEPQLHAVARRNLERFLRHAPTGR